jgi:sporulation protein YlmC with PRC-barrel domain
MITQNDIARLNGADVYDTAGDKIGSVGQVYLDAQSGNPQWVTVKTGLLGTKETFVPLRDATVTDDQVTVAYGNDQVKDAPNIEADDPMSQTGEGQLYTYYGLSGTSGYGDGYQNDTNTYQGDAGYTDRHHGHQRQQHR